MSQVVSKNLYDLLGNDVEDGSEVPAAPAKIVEKASTHTAKRNADGAAPSKAPAQSRGPRGGAVSGNEAAFRDRNAGHDRNRSKPTEDARGGSGPRGGYSARGRGSRGGRFPRNQDDRHSKTGITDSEKATAQGWGATEGEAELKDEQAGEEIAKSEQKQAEGEAAAEEANEEEEEKHMTLDQYLAQVAEKKLAIEQALPIRKPNEGVSDNKKWAKNVLEKDENEEYFAGTGGKAKRERERKVKQLLEIDNRYVEPERSGRGGGRGGRGGPRGDGARGRGRGGGRGDARGGRGDSRGGRGGAPRPAENRAPVNPDDQSAFPSLGK
ncbi:Stm1-domain-containing protein [Echria macrotheca]|uniref:Stm1-domain-containing protein n=1 Tax=Echria macrotheca TaxID=438768 RepID=A0AAJ0FCB1_9PEZI|nr:Stm1-domain-containing protein [Echria macrotheca]